MMKHMRLAALSLALSLAAGSALAQTYGYQDYDTNRDAQITRDEFMTGAGNTQYFSYYDTDSNGVITREEFDRVNFARWDQNRNQRIEREEYDRYSSNWIGDQDYFSQWDEDRSGWLDQREYTAGIGEYGLYDRWNVNTDGGLSENELYGGTYDLYANDEGLWGEDEYGAYEDDDWF